MIVVLCNSYQEASFYFEEWMEMLEDELGGIDIVRAWFGALCVETDENLRYIFTDRKYAGLFKKYKPDYVTCADFFEGLFLYLN